jgi:23S rRNA (uracil1939-C5)-methyltransferase
MNPFRPKSKRPHAAPQSAKKNHPARTGSYQPQPKSAPEQQLVDIIKPIYGGAFLARTEGKAIFVPLTLPGEQARVTITQDKRGYATADPDEILNRAPDRVAPACPHFGPCGGCHYQHATYPAQLTFKQAILRETLERAGVTAPTDISVLSADPWHYRNRIRLAFDAAGNPGYRGRRSHDIVPITECPIAAPLLLQSAKVFADLARQSNPPLAPTELSLFCNADETALLATMTVSDTQFSKAEFESFALSVAEKIPVLKGAEVVVETGAKQPPRTLFQWGAPSLYYHAANSDFRVDHGAFFQVNRFLIDALSNSVTAGHSGHLAWDLFAGVGLFARQFANSFAQVIAVESAPSATQALAANLKGTTATAVRATTLDFLRRNREARPDLIVLDPPRTGLGPDITTLLAALAAPALVYVSCDPATLARDLGPLLAAGYAFQSLTLADLFPQTFHLEAIVQLRRA